MSSELTYVKNLSNDPMSAILMNLLCSGYIERSRNDLNARLLDRRMSTKEETVSESHGRIGFVVKNLDLFKNGKEDGIYQ